MHIDKKRVTVGLLGAAYIFGLVALAKHLKSLSERLNSQ